MSTTVVLTTPLYGTPCPDCGLPADRMDTCRGWARIFHPATRPCDIGVPPAPARRETGT